MLALRAFSAILSVRKQAQGVAQMSKIKLSCIHHPHLFWFTKPEAVSAEGDYTGTRRIFFDLFNECDGQSECECDATCLYAVPGQSWDGKNPSMP